MSPVVGVLKSCLKDFPVTIRIRWHSWYGQARWDVSIVRKDGEAFGEALAGRVCDVLGPGVATAASKRWSSWYSDVERHLLETGWLKWRR
jgi:hypothetical protein